MRSTPIERAKERMGYQNANARPSCRNCAHSQQGQGRGIGDSYPWYCNRGVFGTTALAVCDEHQVKCQKGGAA